MAIKSLKQAQAAIDGLQGQIDELWEALNGHDHPRPQKADTSAVEAGVALPAASVKVLAEQVAELAANPPVPDGDALIKVLENKGVMLRKS